MCGSGIILASVVIHTNSYRNGYKWGDKVRLVKIITIWLIVLIISIPSISPKGFNSINISENSSNVIALNDMANLDNVDSPFFKILRSGLINSTIGPLLFEPHNNRLLVGTAQGISIVNISDWNGTNLTTDNGLAGPSIGGLAIDTYRNILYASCNANEVGDTHGLSLYNLSTGIITNLRPEDGLPSSITSCEIYNPIRDVLYFGASSEVSDGFGIYSPTTSTFEVRNYTHGLPSQDTVAALDIDNMNQVLYIGTLGGLAVYDIRNESISTKYESDGLPERHVLGLEIDTERQLLYIGTWSSWLSVYDITNDTFTNYWIPNQYYINEDGVGDLALDTETGLLYIGTGWNGLHVFDTVAKRFVDQFTEEDGLPYRNASPLLWDPINNYLYIGSLNGLAVYDPYYVSTRAPTIQSSENVDTTGNHTISWSLVYGAEWYVLERASTADFSESAVAYVGNNTETMFSNLSAGTYWYRVRGNNSIRTGEWGDPISLTVVVPPRTSEITILKYTPSQNLIMVEWESIPEADYYILEERCLANNSDWYIAYNGCDNSSILYERPTGTFEYRVRAYNAAGFGNYSSVMSTNTNWSIWADAQFSLMLLAGVCTLVIVVVSVVSYNKIRRKRCISEKMDNEEKEEET